MKLKEFINELESISHQVSNPDVVDVQMADCIPVVKPILLENTVYITDTDPEEKEE